MFQHRPMNGGLPYAPFRDIVNCFPALAKKAVLCLEEDAREPWFRELFEHFNVTDEELEASVISLATFIGESTKIENDDISKVIEKSKITELPASVIMLLLSRIGQTTLAMFYATARDALRSDESLHKLEELLETVNEVCSNLKQQSVEV